MKKEISFNIIFSMILQVVAIVNSFVVSKVTILYFGSEINGLIASINQFLNYISLLEGGIGAVVMANLFKPLYEHNNEKIAEIIYSSKKFFEKIILIFVLYTLILSIIYPYITGTPIGIKETVILVWILSISLCAQFFFAISYKILLQADHKLYICSIIQILAYILNVIFVIATTIIYDNILIVKLFSSLAFLVQPILYSIIVKKKYNLKIRSNSPPENIKGRWDGFFQNFSFFVNNNTDIVLITIVLGLKEVSVYATYMLVINGMKSLILSISSSFQSTLGKKLVSHNKRELQAFFKRYFYIILFISLVGYCCVILLIRNFIQIYVGNSDYLYDRFYFPLIIAVSQLVIVIREPFNLLINSANKFRETNIGAILEAVINIFISVVLINKLGLVGVAIGTLIASIFRSIYFVKYLHSNIIFLDYMSLIKPCLLVTISIFITSLAYYQLSTVECYSWLALIIIGIVSVFVISALVGIVCVIIWPKKSYCIFKSIISSNKM